MRRKVTVFVGVAIAYASIIAWLAHCQSDAPLAAEKEAVVSTATPTPTAEEHNLVFHRRLDRGEVWVYRVCLDGARYYLTMSSITSSDDPVSLTPASATRGTGDPSQCIDESEKWPVEK